MVSGPYGLLNALKPGSIFAIGSTLGPAPVRRVAATLAAKGCATIDMLITGGYLAAANGKLALMLGGEQNVIDRAWLQPQPAIEQYCLPGHIVGCI